MEPKIRKTPKRLMIEIHEDDHRKIKTFASYEGLTLKDWVIQALIAAIEIKNKNMINKD